jgi:hypothetical protein
MAAAGWLMVMKSWENVGEVGLPICRPANPDTAPPDWWHHNGEPAGKQAWQRLVAKHQKYQKQMESHDSSNEDDEDDEDGAAPAPRPRSSKGKSKAKPDAKDKPRRRKPRSSAQGPTNASRRATAQPRASTSTSAAPPTRVLRKRSAQYVEVDSTDEGGSSGDWEGASPRASQEVERRSQSVPSKRPRMLSISHLVVESKSLQRGGLPERHESEQTQPEVSPRHCSGPESRQADTPPQLPANAISPELPVPESSSLMEQGTYATPGVASH